MTNDKLIELCFDAGKTFFIVVMAVFGGLQAWNTYNERKLKEAIEKAKESSVGATAMLKLTAEFRDLVETVNDIRESILKDRESLQDRFDKLWVYFNDMAKDYAKILTNKH